MTRATLDSHGLLFILNSLDMNAKALSFKEFVFCNLASQGENPAVINQINSIIL